MKNKTQMFQMQNLKWWNNPEINTFCWSHDWFTINRIFRFFSSIRFHFIAWQILNTLTFSLFNRINESEKRKRIISVSHKGSTWIFLKIGFLVNWICFGIIKAVQINKQKCSLGRRLTLKLINVFFVIISSS